MKISRNNVVVIEVRDITSELVYDLTEFLRREMIPVTSKAYVTTNGSGYFTGCFSEESADRIQAWLEEKRDEPALSSD